MRREGGEGGEREGRMFVEMRERGRRKERKDVCGGEGGERGKGCLWRRRGGGEKEEKVGEGYL